MNLSQGSLAVAKLLLNAGFVVLEDYPAEPHAAVNSLTLCQAR